MKSVSTRFLVPFGLLAVLISMFVFYLAYEASRKHATELMYQQAAMALEFNLAIRSYAGKHIRPVMERMVDKDVFMPETMSTSFISRSIFEEVRKKFPDYIVRFSSENPRNPINSASPDELRMIEFFRGNPQIDRWTEEIEIEGKHYLAHFKPRRIRQECMRCHDTPEDAPAELIKLYGATASFHRKLGDIAGLDTVAVPMDAIHASLASEMRSQSMFLAAGLALLLGSIFLVFRLVVTRRIVTMSNHFNEIAAHAESSQMTPVEVRGNDEITALGVAFNQLVEKLRSAHAYLELRVSRRTEELRRANEHLKSELTERKRAEEALKESQRQLADIINFLPDATFVIDREGKVIAWNRAVEEMTGIKAADMLGKGDHEYALPFYGERRPVLIDFVFGPHDEVAENYVRLDKKENVFVSEAYIPALGEGGIYLFATAGALRDSRGNIVGAIESLRDITERRRAQEEKEKLEAQLRQAHKMEAVGTLAGGIAHDFNNILAAIIGYTEMAIIDVPRSSPSQNYLQQVLNAGLRAKELVQQILAFSRMKLNQERAPTEIAPIIEDAIKLLRASLPATIEIRQYIGAESGMVLTDATEIHQVLINLCANAAQAMEQRGGALEIRLDEIIVDSKTRGVPEDVKPGHHLRLSVGDTGHGMAPEVLDRIFDPYFTTKEVGKGSGLGLAVVHGIVKRHQGVIDVRSKPGEGTTFTVYLPGIEGRAPEQTEPDSPVPRGAERILFVDDEEVLADLGKQMLEGLGYSVLAQTSGVEALESFKAHPDQFDLVITDYTMPRLTGDDFAKEVMRIRPDIPVILCTGSSERVVRREVGDVPIRAFVAKPLNLRDMAEVVRKTLDGVKQ
ncbi:MAG: DUF3365 domain-containing protein [Syntrophobacteraceae bacterium]